MDAARVITLRAPAKVNLSLRVLGRREDGFHALDTLMAPISLADELTLERLDQGGVAFACDDPELPTGEDNLVIKAVRAFEKAFGKQVNVSIALKKRVPSGAGLGGGSSDAATVLKGLNALYGEAVDFGSLEAAAAAIGSDVPFFLHTEACRCQGRGELIQPEPLGSTLRLLLVKPAFGVSTPDAYGRWANSSELPGVAYGAHEVEGLELVNDLERPVFEKYPILAVIKAWLIARGGVSGALMSGSGSTMFAILEDGACVDALSTDVRTEFGDGCFVAEVRTEP